MRKPTDAKTAVIPPTTNSGKKDKNKELRGALSTALEPVFTAQIALVKDGAPGPPMRAPLPPAGPWP